MGGIMYKAIVTSNHVCSEDGQTRCNEDRPLPEYTHTHFWCRDLAHSIRFYPIPILIEDFA